MSEVRTIVNFRNFLGEGPIWSHEEQALYWVDIKRGQIFRHIPKTQISDFWDLRDMTAVVAPTDTSSKVLAVCQGNIKWLDTPTGRTGIICEHETHLPTNRPNDGKVDKKGRLWFGTTDDLERERTGSLYCLEKGEIRKVASDIGNPNTFAWSPDGTRLYTADSVDQTMYVYDFDMEAGKISNRRQFFTLKGTDIIPDGSTVDADGYLWNAQWNGWRVVRYSPEGEVDRIIEMPTACPTSCIFGGENLQTLYITSARKDQSDEALSKQPDAGAVFALEPGVTGIAETPYLFD